MKTYMKKFKNKSNAFKFYIKQCTNKKIDVQFWELADKRDVKKYIII